MGTATRGNAAEAMVLSALIQRDFEVLLPFGGGQPYDLVVDLGSCFLRVQCKRAWPNEGCLMFNCRSTDHGKGSQSYRGLADIFGLFFPPTESVYLVPIGAVAEFEGRLRLEPTRNNQRKGVRMAAGYAIDRWTPNALREVVAGGRIAPGLELSIA
jgi:PD-(D/E)XK endonuclease